MNKIKGDSLRGLFITFEGGEGAGKSTLIASLASKLKEKGLDPLITREPGGSELGKTIRSWLLDKDSLPLSKRAELLLFLADRAQHVEEKLLPALKEGKIILCDRYIDSTLAYQGYGRGLNQAELVAGCHLATGGLEPDLTFLLDLPPQVGLSRRQERDRFEEEEIGFHERVRQGFLALAKSRSRIHVIDATKPPKVVLQEAWAVIARYKP